MKFIRATLIVIGLATQGVIIGGLLGYVTGMAYVILADISSIEGESGYTVFYEFVPVGALLGMIFVPVIFRIWRRAHR